MYPLLITVMFHCHVSFQGCNPKIICTKTQCMLYLPGWVVDLVLTQAFVSLEPLKVLGDVSLGVHSHRSSPDIG